MDCKKSLCWRSNLSNWWHNFTEAKSDNGMDFGGQALNAWGNETVWSEIGQDLEDRAAHPHQEFPGVFPPGPAIYTEWFVDSL